MAITHTETVIMLEVLTSNTNNIVGKVAVNIASSDDSNASKYKSEGTDSFLITTSGITTSTAGFVAYEDLTESTVKGWISAGLSTSKAKANNVVKINKLIADDNRTTEDKALPW